MDKCLSIITNFGCHGLCPYCIVRENGINVPKTTLEGLDKLGDILDSGDYNIVSVSGGGDPLHEYEKHKDWYAKLFTILDNRNIPLEMHTSYVTSSFPYGKCKRVVYHLRKDNAREIYKIRKQESEIVRCVFVATEDLSAEYIMEIALAKCMQEIVFKQIDELSFRQMVDDNYVAQDYNTKLLEWGHKKGFWHYIKQNDYNDYYVEGKIYKKFSEIHA